MSEISEEDNTRKIIAALEARVSDVQRIADAIHADTEKTAKILSEVKSQSESLRSSVDSDLQLAERARSTISELMVNAQLRVQQIEDATSKANSESAFATNAKNNAEEHAKAISQLRGSAEVEVAAVTASKKNAEELAKGIAISSGTAAAELKVISEGKATAIRDAAVVTASAERVAAVMPSIDQGSKDANAISAAKDGAEAATSALVAMQSQTSEAAAKAASESASITKINLEVKKLLASMNEATTTANDAQQRVEAYESEIARLNSAFEATQTKLEGLLPHATSAGLASAFHIQKSRFSKPRILWLTLFVGAICALLIVAACGLPPSNETWDSILRHLVNRLPLVAPLIWLAIYSGHHYNMALRMEEDYAFKEALSTAFEGYKREMLAIPGIEGNAASPLVTLCENVLRSLAERPGRIYEGKNEVITPLTPIANVIKDTVAETLKSKGTASQPESTGG